MRPLFFRDPPEPPTLMEMTLGEVTWEEEEGRGCCCCCCSEGTCKEGADAPPCASVVESS
jgi:hypothetical protein